MADKNKNERVEKSLKMLAKSSFIVLIGVFLSKLFSYLYKIIIARSLGPDIYGTFILSISIAGVFITISSLGLTDGLLRYIPLFLGKKEK